MKFVILSVVTFFSVFHDLLFDTNNIKKSTLRRQAKRFSPIFTKVRRKIYFNKFAKIGPTRIEKNYFKIRHYEGTFHSRKVYLFRGKYTLIFANCECL